MLLPSKDVLQIRLLGDVSIVWEGKVLSTATTPRTLRLLAFILLHRGQIISRERIATLFWPDDCEDVARTNLRRHLHYLGKLLPDDGAAWLDITRHTVAWNVDSPYWLDVEAFARASAGGDVDGAIALYSGNLYTACPDEWIEYDRHRLNVLHVANLERAIERASHSGDKTALIQYAGMLLRVDPFREDVVRQLIGARLAVGDRSGAVVEYEQFAQRLREEFAAEPMDETTAAVYGTEKLTAVIVDDEPLARNRVRALLRESFPEIDVVGEYRTGRQALDGIRTAKPTIAFLDIQMPNMDGFEMLDRLTSAAGPIPEIIFTTGYDAYAIKAFEVQAVDYLLKPFSGDRFAEAVSRAIDRACRTRRHERVARPFGRIKKAGVRPEPV